MTYTLQILHASDLEGGVDALSSAPNFAAIVDTLEDTYDNSVTISAGDNYIPGPFFSTAADFSMGGVLTDAYTRYYTELLSQDLSGVELDLGRGGGRVDVSIMNIIGFDASAVGNHEFDPGIDAFASIIQSESDEGVIEWIGANFPYLTSNIDFTDSGLEGSFTNDILSNTAFNESLADIAAGETTADIAPATLLEENGELIGVVGATTQIIETISSTGAADETTGGQNDMAALAAVLQPQIDRLIDAGANKIILTSHLQQIALEKELAGLLTGVDVIIAGGSDTLLADDGDRLREGDEASETYPFLTTGADDNPVAIVSTDGEYSYVGRLVVEFDDEGVLMTDSIDAAVSGAFATDEQGVLDVTGEETLNDAINNSLKADIVDDLTSAVGAIVEEKDGIIYGAHDVFLDGRRESVRTEETNLGRLSAEANLDAARGADDSVLVSFKNGGGIRAAIGGSDDDGTNEGDGQLSQLDLENALRFNNDLTLVTLSAEGLMILLEHAVAGTDTEAGNTPGRFPQVAGLRFSFDENGTAQELAADDDGNYIIDPETGLPQVETAGGRIKTVALIDPETGEDIIIVQNGELTSDAPASIRMVTLNFLVDNNGDGYPFQELATNIEYLTDDGSTTTDGDADNLLGEQVALANFFTENFSGDTAFAEAETDVANDRNIVQLARNGNTDLILLGEADPTISVEIAATLESGETELFTGGSEVVSVEDGVAYVTNGAQDRIDVFSLETGAKLNSFDLSGIANYDGVQSVAVKNGLIAAAVAREGEGGTAMNGVVALFDTDGAMLAEIEVGNLPDMVTFTPDGSKILVANEGEPGDETDPAGTVSIIDVSDGAEAATVVTADFTAFDGTEDALREAGVLIQPGKSASEDLEPEYITVLPGGETAWVALQEANAYAVLDLTTNTVTALRSFGLVDRSAEGYELDASNRDNAINLQNYDNLFGMRQPDAIQAYEIDGTTYVLTANEGDARDATEARVKDLELDPEAFENAELLQRNEVLGRLKVRTDLGDTDGDGDHDVLYHYGSRSYTIYDVDGNIVFDSASHISQVIAEIRPEKFNADDGEFDGRSDDKGVEPEAISVGMVEGRVMVFVGLERDNGIYVADISDPENPKYVGYIDGEASGHLSPETIAFVAAEDSATGKAQIVVAYEGDGNTVVYDVDDITKAKGTDGDDRLIGTEGADELNGGDGSDIINGLGGDDLIFGGSTDADLRDVVYAGDGNDTADGGAGNDLLYGMDGNDELLGGLGEDELVGQNGDDNLAGGALSDLLFGGAGMDFINGGSGFDRLNGGADADKFYHAGAEVHGSDWVQDFDSAEGDMLVFGIADATADDFVVNFAETEGAGEAGVNEAFVSYVPTGQILFALIDGAELDEINLQVAGSGTSFDLLA